MGLIRKQAGLDMRETILRWRDNFLENMRYSCHFTYQALPVNEDFTIDASQIPRSILQELLDDPDQIIPDYVLFDFSRLYYILDISLYADSYTKVDLQDVLNKLNKIDKHLINLTTLDISLYSLVVNFRVERVNGVWQIANECYGANTKTSRI